MDLTAPGFLPGPIARLGRRRRPDVGGVVVVIGPGGVGLVIVVGDGGRGA